MTLGKPLLLAYIHHHQEGVAVAEVGNVYCCCSLLHYYNECDISLSLKFGIIS